MASGSVVIAEQFVRFDLGEFLWRMSRFCRARFVYCVDLCACAEKVQAGGKPGRVPCDFPHSFLPRSSRYFSIQAHRQCRLKAIEDGTRFEIISTSRDTVNIGVSRPSEDFVGWRFGLRGDKGARGLGLAQGWSGGVRALGA